MTILETPPFCTPPNPTFLFRTPRSAHKSGEGGHGGDDLSNSLLETLVSLVAHEEDSGTLIQMSATRRGSRCGADTRLGTTKLYAPLL